MIGNTDSFDESTKSTNIISLTPTLACVFYPGFVQNVDKAIETLGGIRNIENATSGQKKHLELNFRPNNYHSKPVLGDRDTKPNLLVKLVLRKIYENGKIINQEVVDYHVVGLTGVNLKFTRICDFQYLPLISAETKFAEDELFYAYDQIIPKELPTEQWLWDNLAEDPLYLVPYQFSKYNNQNSMQLHFERPKFYDDYFVREYCEKFRKQYKSLKKVSSKEKFVKATVLCRYEDDVPLEPTHQAKEIIKKRHTRRQRKSQAEITVREFFDRRPIWSRSALIYHSKVTSEQLKLILPSVAYHYVCGPWRVLWVRLGYDPRTDPDARLLQTFDYRVRSRGASKIRIRTKRFRYDYVTGSENKFSMATESVEETRKTEVEENCCILRKGLLPAARQTFYQFCDIRLPEIESMIAKLPAILPGAQCDPKFGWLPCNFSDMCREIVNKYVNEQISNETTVLKKQTVGADELFEASSGSSSDSDSDDNVEITEISDDTDDFIVLDTAEKIQQALNMIDCKPGTSSAS